MDSDLGVPDSTLPERGDRPVPAVDHEVFVQLLTRVGCHVYSGQVSPDGTYEEIYTGPGSELFLGGTPESDDSTAWNDAVHPEDRDLYRSAATVESDQVVEIEYRMIGLDGVTRWVLDQMWLRERTPDGYRIVDGVVTDITSRKRAELGLLELAHTDSLTGLANRFLLSNRIDQALDQLGSQSKGIALLVLDLDGFKAVNDSFGHAVGDELLMMVSRRLRRSLRSNDLAARLGGDEFAVLIEDVDHDQALVAAQRLMAAVCTPFVLARGTVAISASVGLVHADDNRGSVDLMRDADVAMYRAKSDGKNRIVSFEPAMQARVMRRLELEGELRRSVEDGDFVLHYQPLLDLSTLQIVGAEALIRWEHPERGQLAPGEFIEVAEDTGLIVPLGRWVIQQAARDAAAWQTATGRRLSVSVNLSPRQLHDPELLQATSRALASAGLPSESLVIEITENLLLNDAELARDMLASLRALGVRVAVDDFGTGYSSLAYLDRYPVDVLKVDRSFVEPLGTSVKSAALVRSIVDLAAALEMACIAEGVENEQQVVTLRSLGCHLAQGFMFAKPRPAEDLLQMLESQPAAGSTSSGPSLRTEFTAVETS